MQKKTIIVHRIEPRPLAVITSGICAVCGLLLGILIYITYLVTLYLFTPKGENGQLIIPREAMRADQFSPLVLLMTFILYGLTGYFVGYVGAIVYNFIAKKFGGIKLKISQE